MRGVRVAQFTPSFPRRREPTTLRREMERGHQFATAPSATFSSVRALGPAGWWCSIAASRDRHLAWVPAAACPRGVGGGDDVESRLVEWVPTAACPREVGGGDDVEFVESLPQISMRTALASPPPPQSSPPVGRHSELGSGGLEPKEKSAADAQIPSPRALPSRGEGQGEGRPRVERSLRAMSAVPPASSVKGTDRRRDCCGPGANIHAGEQGAPSPDPIADRIAAFRMFAGNEQFVSDCRGSLCVDVVL